MAEKGYRVYDFALPMLLLHALFTGETKNLAHWLNICPRNQFTTLDTHDGIGVVDVRGLLTDEQIDRTKEIIYAKNPLSQKLVTTAAYKSLDIYQINCSYYSALGNNDAAYLLARAVQMFAPGIPQVYYVGMLAGENDIELVEATKNGRDINRHSYTVEEISREVKRPVVRALFNLMKFRNDFPAFQGDCTVGASGSTLNIRRVFGGHWAELAADMKSHDFSIMYSEPGGNTKELKL